MLFTLQLAFRDQGLCFWYPPRPQIIRESFFLSTDRKNVEKVLAGHGTIWIPEKNTVSKCVPREASSSQGGCEKGPGAPRWKYKLKMFALPCDWDVLFSAGNI